MNKHDTEEYWIIDMNVDHAGRRYSVKHVYPGIGQHSVTPTFYVQVSARDEIGAFNEAQKLMSRLGFLPGDVA